MNVTLLLLLLLEEAVESLIKILFSFHLQIQSKLMVPAKESHWMQKKVLSLIFMDAFFVNFQVVHAKVETIARKINYPMYSCILTISTKSCVV